MGDNSTELDTWALSPTGRAILSVVFGGIILTGIVGNILVITLIILVQKLHSAVNLCLGSLAVTDLMVLAILPILSWDDLYYPDQTVVGKEFCIFNISIDRTATVCSAMIFLLIGVERYMVLCHPLKSIGFWTYKKVGLLLVIIFALTAGVSIPYGYLTIYVEFQSENNTHTYCYMDSEAPWTTGYETGLYCVIFFLPIPILIVLYWKMISALKAQVPDDQNQSTAAKTLKKSRSQVVWMLVALMTVFIICLLPMRIFVLLYYYHPQIVIVMNKQSYFTFNWFCRIILYVNHASNPIIYFTMSENYREGFKSIFCKKCFQDKSVTTISLVRLTQLSSV